jgi:PAS domain S-box-containing protein
MTKRGAGDRPQPAEPIPIDTRALFAAMSDAVLVLDRSGRWLGSAPTAISRDATSRRRGEWLIGKRISEVFEDANKADRLLSAITTALDTGETQNVEYRVDVWGDERWFAAAVSPMEDDRVVWVARDITDRVAAQRTLEQQVEERTRELAALLEVSRALSAATSLEGLVDTILAQLKLVVEYSGASVIRIEGTKIAILDSVGPAGREEEIIGRYIDLKERTPQWWSAISRGEALVVKDVRDEEEGRYFRELLAEYQDLPTFGYIRSWMAAPMLVEERVLGWISMSKDQPAFFTDRHVQLAMALARQAAVAFENTSLLDQTKRRTRELDALLDVSRGLASTLELRPVMELILDRLYDFVPYAGAAVNLIEGSVMQQVALRRPRGPEILPEDLESSVPMEDAANLGLPRASGEVLVIDDVRGDSAEAMAYREMMGGDLEGTRVAYVRSLLALPLIVRERLAGMLMIAHDEPSFFRPEHTEILRPLAEQAAVAIGNAQAFEEVQARTREMSALLEVMRTVSSTLDVGELVGVTLEQLKLIIDHTGSSVLIERDGALEIMGARARTDATIEIGARFPLSADAILTQTIRRGDHVIINDVWADDPMAESYRRVISSVGLLDQMPFIEIKSWMGMPMIAEGELVGMLTLSKTQTGQFTEEHARLVRAFADQVAIGIERARLFAQGTRLAAVEERQRLARELHDSVSQALYGIALGARTARTQLDREPEKAVEPVEYVLSLAEAGLTEMRALIFELRPESLETEGLVAAIQKQAAALEARYSITVTCELCDEPEVAPDVREAAYRIVQEALTNAVKHSKAANISVGLKVENGRLRAEVTDDGTGFDPDRDYAGHLGLHSMRERAAKLGGEVSITSTPGSGARVVAEVPVATA